MIVNLTPHPVRIYTADRPDGLDDLELGLVRVIDPEPTPARLAVLPLSTQYLEGIRVEVVEYLHTDHLPDPQEGTSLIVSLPVALALLPRRNDLLVPYSEVRSASGTVIGCRQLAQPV
ncbi:MULTISPECIES: hypothetical protein [Streptomyces]|uniref:hypothetical protein n=1 Tax=Streptomyces TaxID=1883 RepID=UPI00073DEACB|nr:hypothetical protein [Streptomyces sp. FBKL.4005]MYU28673.1 hypothetical protein [Streptomyces sp. SID7810]OYP17066.1 hypothetical protein CFC35_23265 [Streptomyces sp. FBKL.4005]CUW29713.1 hypothetical protein TUE45_04422 [Streptomyces reticuli]